MSVAGKGRPPLRLLILGGTVEASSLARALAGRPGIEPLLSFAGRTESPTPPPIPHRVGGFGGAAGLACFLRERAIDAVIDATHPFAARISANAVEACREADRPLVVYTRPAWSPSLRHAQATKRSGEPPLDRFAPLALMKGADSWVSVPDIDAAVAVLSSVASDDGVDPSLRGARATKQSSRPLLNCLASRAIADRRDPLRVFLTIGRLDLRKFRAAPQHRYLARSIDPPDPADLPPHATVVLARPPFAVADEVALMRAHGIDLLVTKNSGGAASVSKLAAARELGLPVLMVERPSSSGAHELNDLDAVLAWIHMRASA